MGFNSDRPLTRSERIAEYAKEVSKVRDTSTFEFQSTVGATIRGDLGIEKGNRFIQAIREANQKW